MEFLKIITIISLTINVILGTLLLRQSIKKEKNGTLNAGISGQDNGKELKEIIDKCLPKNEPTMGELEEE